MKRLSRIMLAIFLAVLMAGLLPVQVFADTPEYVSEIKIGMGAEAKDAKAALKGYTIIDTDLNQTANDGEFLSKGDKAVYIGYKTTKNRREAITDLALMNMKGGYSVAEYEALMETQMKSQILPFIKDFQVAINEYRANYNSRIKANRQRAIYIHDILNKLIDDDTKKGLGDLLLNPTKQELGDEAYNKLSDEEKMNHADLATIIAQSNGKATLLLKDLLTRACDTSTDTWINRFIATTYEDLIAQTGKSPTDARKELAKKYDDDANKILSMWETFRKQLLESDIAAEKLEDMEEPDEDEILDKIDSLDENSEVEEIVDAMEALSDVQEQTAECANNLADVAVATYLSTFNYGEGTLYDFFTQTKDAVEGEITMLYPMAAALSEGQSAGLEFISLRELVLITDQSKDYDDIQLDELNETSIYEGVDREIYKKGGVALTSDSLRQEAMLNESYTDTSSLSTLTRVFLALSIASGVGLVSSLLSKPLVSLVNKIRLASFNSAKSAAENAAGALIQAERKSFNKWVSMDMHFGQGSPKAQAALAEYNSVNAKKLANDKIIKSVFEPINVNSTAIKYFAIGFTVATVIFTAVTVYLSYQDMKEQYEVEFTPIPHYMIDEKDLIGYNEKGEKIVLKNQTAYYKAVECNRSSSDEYYSAVGTCADLNGDVGAQWLALYVAKNETENPILADSFTVKVDDNNIPAGYSTGIHMFGSETAFNLNSQPYDWNKSAKSVFVYFKRDESLKASAAGTSFSGGMLAVAGVGGVLLGAIAAGCATKVKKNKSKAEIA